MILPDVLRPGLKVVFCGSAAGRASARAGAYYAGPGNRFWPTLYAIGLTPRLLSPAEFWLALDYGIGLTDIVKKASGADSTLRPADFDSAGLGKKMKVFAPGILAFNGKRAAQAFYGGPLECGLQAWAVHETAVFVLPSTSGAARRFWSIDWWQMLANQLQS